MSEPSLGESDILYMDDAVVAVNKPPGMLVHRSALERRAPTVMRELRQLTGRMVWPVHRLDRPTSGMLLMAFSPEVASVLNDDFRNRRVKKTYLAVVRGVTPESATIDHPVKNSRGNPKDAVSHFKTLDHTEVMVPVGRYPSAMYSLVSVAPETGRYHQIRQHFHHISNPICGDTVYGDGRHNRLFRNHFDMHRLLLFSVSLAFTHPARGETMQIDAGVDEKERALFKALGWGRWIPEDRVIAP